ncbi:hypothetical protein CONPUDRAFT_54267, partial [Coniophora puteana RWD-64-598 SS2]
HEYLRDWQAQRSVYLHTVADLHQRSLVHTAPDGDQQLPMCKWCQKREPTWRCDDCFAFPEGCQDCFRSAHQHLPFHNVHTWTGTHYEPSFLSKSGLVIYLGHGGTKCPTAAEVGEDRDEGVGLGLKERLSVRLGLRKSFTRKHTDGDGNMNMVVVDTNGLHQIPVNFCRCEGKVGDDVQLLQHGLYPASQTAPRTAFTFRVLDEFLLQNRECKVPAMSYISHLQRKTMESMPQEVPVRYAELNRCSQQWRLLNALLHHGEHASAVADGKKSEDHQLHLKQGSLATVCPGCPRPQINMPDGWQADPDGWKYGVTLCMDGNFKADHLRMRKQVNDVPMTDGAAYMTESKAYQEHLHTYPDKKEVSTCNAHRAVTQANQTRGLHKDVTGIAALACARHGFFIPGTVVDFQKGEKFANIDWALWMGILWYFGVLRVLVLYDIWCIFGIHLLARFAKSNYMNIPLNVTIMGGIGQFHVHGHKDACVARWSPAYILGAGNVDGEILETLWAALNEISRSTRSMTTSHRKEVLDDHMDDSNWKKLVRIVLSLAEKWKRAIKEFPEAQEAFVDLTAMAGPELVAVWTAQLEQAQADRMSDPAAMDILNVQVDDMPTQADIQTELSTHVRRVAGQLSTVDWIADGMEIQSLTCPIRLRVKELVKAAAGNEQVEADHKAREARRTLDNRMRVWLNDAPRIMGSLAYDIPDPIADGGPEDVVLPLPSHFGVNICQQNDIATLAHQETELRHGQMNDAINEVKILVGRKAMVYTQDIRSSTGSVRKRTRAQDKLVRADDELHRHVNIYETARKAAERLGEPDPKYKELKSAHLVARTTSVAASLRGTKNEHLPWFWRVEIEKAERDGGLEWMETFDRIQWMRAKCRRDRWREEIIILQEEMKRVPKSFQYEANKWADRVQNGGAGYSAFAHGQQARWNNLKQMAEATFETLPSAPSSI